jgi:hypothetical protein
MRTLTILLARALVFAFTALGWALAIKVAANWPALWTTIAAAVVAWIVEHLYYNLCQNQK